MNANTVATELVDKAAALMPELVAKFTYPPASIEGTPAVMAVPQHVDFRKPDRGTNTLEWTIALVVGIPHDEESHTRLGNYLSDPGPVRAALNGSGSAYHWCDVSAADADVWRIGGVDYLTAVFTATTIGDGS